MQISNFSPASPSSQLRALLRLGETVDDPLLRALDGGAIDWPLLLRLAGDHFVTPSLAAAMRRKGLHERLHEDVRAYLDAIQALNAERNETLRRQLVETACALNRIGVRPLLLKGANALLPDHDEYAQDRVIGDLDLLVPADRVDDAVAAVVAAGYRSYEQAFPRRKEILDRKHQAAALLHLELPVKVEIHRRFLVQEKDSARLQEFLTHRAVVLDGRATVLVPDPATRLIHNFLHAQISNRQAQTRLIEIRQLLDFALLARAHARECDVSELTRRLRPGRRDLLAQYWGHAEQWLDAPYPAELPRSRRQKREAFFVELVATRPLYASLFERYAYLSRLPGRFAQLVPRLWREPEYIPRRLHAVVAKYLRKRSIDDPL